MIIDKLFDYAESSEENKKQYKYYLTWIIDSSFKNILGIILCCFLFAYILGGFIWLPIMAIFNIIDAYNYFGYDLATKIFVIVFNLFLFIFCMLINIDFVWYGYKAFKERNK
jgi:hypothetical protein